MYSHHYSGGWSDICGGIIEVTHECGIQYNETDRATGGHTGYAENTMRFDDQWSG
jgi:hypothetical protein